MSPMIKLREITRSSEWEIYGATLAAVRTDANYDALIEYMNVTFWSWPIQFFIDRWESI